MLSSLQLKQVTAEARPIIERQLADAEMLAGLREVVSAAGGDWGQLKALIKAQIKDENDDAGDGKNVRKILDKADYAKAYADMLGMAKMNEQNYFQSEAAETSADAEGRSESASGAASEIAPLQIQESRPVVAPTGGPFLDGNTTSSAGTEGDEDRQPTPESLAAYAERLRAEPGDTLVYSEELRSWHIEDGEPHDAR